MRSHFKIILILLAIGGILLLYLSLKGKDMQYHDIKGHEDTIWGTKKQEGTDKIPQSEMDSDTQKAIKMDLDPRQKQKKDPSLPSNDFKAVNQKMKTDKSKPFSTTDSSETLKGPNILEVSLDDIARYDQFRQGYVLKKINPFKKEKMAEDLLSLLKVLNRKDMPPDYFQSFAYNSAYKEIDLFYHDTYIWPYFSNAEAKTNFFLYQFTQYAADNEQWRFYEKDKSDCSQFSQRIYLFLSPDEIYMPDNDYFLFLFSSMSNRTERKKLCNKIPNVFYTTITPYILKRDSTEPSPDENSHAMISFAPDNNPENWILGEPQNGRFKRFGEDIGSILDEEYTKHPLICKLGKILSIETDYSHEANTGRSSVYFIPKMVFEGKPYGQNDPRSDYEDKPIKMEDHTYQVFQFISSYIRQVVNKQPINRMDFLRSLEMISWNGELSLSNWKEAITPSVDIIMYGLIELEKSDLQQIHDEMEELENLTNTPFGFSQHTNDFMKEISYLFHLKIEPLL